MLLIKDRIESLAALGTLINKGIEEIRGGKENQLSRIVDKAGLENGWFTKESVVNSIEAIGTWLNVKVLADWSNTYYLSEPAQPKKIAVIMAGNIPLVNFHDFLSVLITGHHFIGKLSSQDKVLLPYLADELIKINDGWKPYIEFTNGMLTEFDGVIATGSNNTSTHFEYYFGKYPNIIRKNRHSIAILTGNETPDELDSLYDDIFKYYGLGCRNVSMLLVPEGYNMADLFKQWEGMKEPIEHHKYKNNYDYYRSIYLLNSTPFFDTGYASFVEVDYLSSPISVINYLKYSDSQYVIDWVEAHKNEIQCIVTSSVIPGVTTVGFGKSQYPGITDYPDNVDIIQFLLAL